MLTDNWDVSWGLRSDLSQGYLHLKRGSFRKNLFQNPKKWNQSSGMTDHEINILEKGAHSPSLFSPSLFMKETSRGWTTKARAGKKPGSREPGCSLQGSPVCLLLGATAQRQLLGYPQRSLITQRSKSQEEKKGGWEYFLTLIFFSWVQSSSFHLLIHCWEAVC